MMRRAAAGATANPQIAVPGRVAANRGAIVRRVLGLAGVIALVFGIILPRVVDCEAVRAALAALTPVQVGLLGAATVVAYVAGSGPYRVLVPGLSWPRATGSDLAARAVVSTVPGPTDVATRFVLYRQWSIPADAASAGIALGSLFEPLSCFALPAIATVGLLVAGHPAESEAVLLAVVGLAALAAAAIALISILGSESLARRLGGVLDRMAEHAWKLCRKAPPASVVERILDLRERSKAMLTRRGLEGFAAAVLGKLAWFVVLEVALWCVGVGPEALPPPAVLTAMGVVGIVSLLPITPGAVGVAEVAYVGILSSVAGPAMTEPITAAVSLFRIAQWLMPIPIGWALLVLLRRGQPGKLLAGPETAPTPQPG